MGKGSNPRPFDVDRQTFRDNYDRIFGRRDRDPDRVQPPQDKQEKPALDQEKTKDTK